MIDEDIDPVEEIRAIRRKHDRRFKTSDAYWAYIKTVPSADILLAQIREKIAKSAKKAAPSRKPVAAKTTAPRRKVSSKRLAHA